MRKLMLIMAILLMASVGWCFPPTPPGGSAPAATEAVAGISERCTDAEMTTGTKTDCDVTPANAKVELDKKLATTAIASSISDSDLTHCPDGNSVYDALAGKGDVTGVLDDTGGDVPMLYQAATAFTINDETPSVSGKSAWKTANAATPTTITQFDSMTAGQMFWVLIDDASTTIDFSQANLSGNAELSYTAASGDLLFCFSPDGTLARCQLIGGGLWGVSGTISDEQSICGEISGGKLLLKSCGVKVAYTEPAGSETLCRTGAATTGACTNPVKLASFAWDGGGSAVATASSKRCTVLPGAAVIT